MGDILISRIKALTAHNGIKQYGANTIWLLGEKILRLVSGLFIGIWVARYLGPEEFGVFSYVLAFVGLFIPLAKLGLDGIICRDIARNDSDITNLLNSSLFIKFIGGLLLVSIATCYMIFTKTNPTYIYLSIILSFVYVVRAFEVLEFYFRAKVKSIYISVSGSIGIIVAACLKVTFIVLSLPLIYFAIANLVEVFISIFCLLIFFRKEAYKLTPKAVNITKSMSLLKESWPLIFSGFFALVYLNIDQIMIEEMLGSYEVGQYSAAVRISSAFYFIPLTIGWSIQTAVVNAKKQSESEYYARLQQLLTLMAILAYILIIPIFFFAEEIIFFSFGLEYSGASSILSVHIWASLFVFLGSIRGLWVINESYFRFALIANMGAGVINVGLNYIWLPQYGITGAAWATFISYGVTYVASGLLFKPAIKIVIMQLKAAFLYDFIVQLKRLK